MKYFQYIASILLLALNFVAGPMWASPKVFDCFPFFNELELLKMRLDELNDVVDYFVLVESIETQRGNIKPLFFEQNKHLFGPYLHKIIHVALREITPLRPPGDWWREHHQRDCIGLGLEGRCAPEDIILISDVDEIPRKIMLPRIKGMLQSGLFAVRLHQDMYRHRLNWIQGPNAPGEKWNWIGTVATTYANFEKYSAQWLRDHRGEPSWGFIDKGGWHFTSIGNNDAQRDKITSVIEGRDNRPTDREIEEAFKVYVAIPIDISYPDYVLRNYDYLVSIQFIDPSIPPTFKKEE